MRQRSIEIIEARDRAAEGTRDMALSLESYRRVHGDRLHMPRRTLVSEMKEIAMARVSSVSRFDQR